VKPEKEGQIYGRYLFPVVMKRSSLSVIFLLTCITCLAQRKELAMHRYFNSFEDSIYAVPWINTNTIVTSDDSVRNCFSKTDASSSYSAGIETAIPPDLQRKNFSIATRGFVRTTAKGANNQLVISISKGDSAIFWKGIPIPDSTAKINAWNAFSKSIQVPANITAGATVKIFVWNADGKSVTGIDSLEILFTEVKFPSFLPE
jgi:hypothetical protein